MEEYHKKYYQEHKNTIDRKRHLHYIKKRYPFIDDDNFDLWKSHGSVIRKIYKELKNIEDEETKDKLINLILLMNE